MLIFLRPRPAATSLAINKTAMEMPIRMFRESTKSESIPTSAPYSLESPRYIRSCIRKQQRCSDGTLLRAKKDQSIITVDFKGTNFEQTTEFYLGQNGEYEANTIKCYLDDQQYYLCVKDGKVFLLETNDPNEKKFMFKIVPANEYTKYQTVKSLETGMYLTSDKFGTASMWKLKNKFGEEPQDRRAWFELINLHMGIGMDTVAMTSEDITFAAQTCEVY